MRRVSFLAIALLVPAWGQHDGDPPPFSPPGRLIDIGGWRLHLNCAGQSRASQPTVILESGIGDFSVEWSLVQPAVSQFARVCSYDRAGDGWSEMGPHPRTFHQIVYELHTLLGKAGVKPPFVLVGHSYGGWLVRQYQLLYPSEVSGLVLVEAGADNPRRILPNGKVGYALDLATGKPLPEIKKSGPLRRSDLGPSLIARMLAGSGELSRHANDPPRDKLPPDAQIMRTWALAQLGHIAAGVNTVEADELAGLHAERIKSEYSIGDLPLIVLTRGLSEGQGPESKAIEEEHRRDHYAVAAMSRKGKLVVAAHSGHHVQLDEPDLVVSAIRELLTAPIRAATVRERSHRKQE